MRATPYDTGKVKIGSAVDMNKLVNIPYAEQDADMLELQTYLLHPPHQVNRDYWLNKLSIAVGFFITTVILFSV